MKTDRVEWVDILKGIGIILVVIGHANWQFGAATTDMFIQKYIYSFHMPLFFFLSGYLFIKEKYPDFKKFLLKKIKTLLVPYLVFSILSVLVQIFICLKYNIKLNSFKEIVIQILYLRSKTVWNEPLWFLMCLFITEIIFYFISKCTNKAKIAISLLMCGIVGYGLSFMQKYFVLPLSFSIALVAVTFYGFGYLVKNSTIGRKVISKNIKISILSFSSNIVIGGLLNSIAIMYFMKYGNIFYFYLAAISGILAYIGISKYINNLKTLTKILSYFGINTMPILCTHYFIFVFLNRIHRLSVLFKNYISIKGYAYAILTLLLSIPIILIINKFFPQIIGKTKNKDKRIRKKIQIQYQ